MKLAINSLALGIGGTLFYYGLLSLAEAATPTADWREHLVRYQVLQFIGGSLLVLLIPGAIPGLILALILARFGIFGPEWDENMLNTCLASPPLVHSYFVYLWLKRRERRRVEDLGTQT